MKNNFPLRKWDSSILWLDPNQEHAYNCKALLQKRKIKADLNVFADVLVFYDWYTAQLHNHKKDYTLFVNMLEDGIDTDAFWSIFQKDLSLHKIPALFLIQSTEQKTQICAQIGKGICGFLEYPLQQKIFLDMFLSTRIYFDNAQ